MAKSSDKPAQIRASLKKLENPYAFIEIEDALTQEQTFADKRRVYLRRLENQYASLCVEDQPPVIEPSVSSTESIRAPRACSKAEFRSECRRIFSAYIPALERGKLRDHHRDFITRNESLSGASRYQLLVQLSKYDLSVHTGIKAQFNRERDVLTEEKLRQIEVDAEVE